MDYRREEGGAPLPHGVIEPTAELILPDDATSEDRAWARDNITSIRRAIRNGKHGSAYYPSSGTDGVRVLVAYDVDHLVCVDQIFDMFSETSDRLRAVGATALETSMAGIQRTLRFELDGRQRTIVEIVGDARLHTPETLGLPQVDVYHAYLPNGSDRDLTEREQFLRERYEADEFYITTDEANLIMQHDPSAPFPADMSGAYRIARRGLKDHPDSYNYQTVREGGFLALGEASAGFSPVLCAIAGLRALPITRRHPYTVSTSLYPNPDELKAWNHMGTIFQKVRTVNPEIVQICTEAPRLDWAFNGFTQGDLYFLGVVEDAAVVQGIEEWHRSHVAEVQGIAHRFRTAGVEGQLASEFVVESTESFKAQFRDLRSNLVAMIGVFEQLFDAEGRTRVDDQEAMRLLDISVDEHYDTLRNGRYPLAYQYGEDRLEFVTRRPYREVVDTIIGHQWSFLSE